MKFKHFIPLLVGLLLGFTLGWWGFLVIFPWIGGWITIGLLISAKRNGIAKDLGRRISILMISPIFLIFLGIIQRENLQIEETVFDTIFFLSSGIITPVVLHYAIAKIIGPFIWGRGFCGWACWTAALLEWLPIKENLPVSKKYTRIRYLVLTISILCPLIFILLGYNWQSIHVNRNGGNYGQLIWFLAGNGIYYLVAICLSIKFKKQRAFRKIVCPISILMKAQTKIALIKKRPSGMKCIKCKVCNQQCPMDVDVMSYISAGKKINSSECILCGKCGNACSQKAIQ
jgi:polyferredoxin